MKAHINIKKPIDLPDRTAVIDWYQKLAESLRQSNQRLIVNCQGLRDWCLSRLPPEGVFDSHIILSNQQDLQFHQQHSVAFSKAEMLLGQQTDCVIYDGFNGINVDVLCMATGLIKAGGVLILLTPENSQQLDDDYGRWQGQSNPGGYFFNYLQQHLKQDMLVLQEQLDIFPELKKLPCSRPPEFINTMTRGQQELFKEMNDWLNDKQKPVFVLTADRGRGKSTLLGRFAQQHATDFNIIVTAPSKSQVSILFNQLDEQSPNIQFMAPDEIIRRQCQIDCLVIDEAAMLPGSMLQQCLNLSNKTLIATTTGGYEGTGQGFLIKFMASLQTDKMIHRQLKDAIRWGQQDHLEQWMNQVLMLKLPRLPKREEKKDFSIQQLSKQQLNENLETLRAVYTLLVSAHYRTRPSDLRQLMEDESQLVFIAKAGSQIVGVALLIQEGGFDAELSYQIFMGTRRPQGHLFAQMMTAQAGIKNFAQLKGLRVQRIAVIENFRLQGVARLLLECAETRLKELDLSYLGSSFSIDSTTAPFWKRTGFNLVHISAGKGRSTGRQTIAVLKSTAPQVVEMIDSTNQKIVSYLPVWLLTYCQSLNWQDVYVILQLLSVENEFSILDDDEITAFSEGYRGFELTQAVLQKLLISDLVKTESSAPLMQLLIEKILLNRDWKNLTGFHGKKEALKKLRLCILKINDQRK